MHKAKDRPEIASQDLDCEPHSIETEQALLGALLLSNGTYHKVSPLTAADDFYEPLHARLFEAVGDLIGKNAPVTPLTPEPFFQGETVGSLTVLQYLGRLLSAATSIISAEHYARMIADLGRRRRLAAIGLSLAQSARHDFATGLEGQIAAAEAKLHALLDRMPRACEFTVGQAARMAIERIAAAFERGGISGLSTGFADLDHLLGGLQPSDLIIMAGRPSMGKTALAMAIAFHIARTTGEGEVSFYSLEMSASQLLMRQLAIDHTIPSDLLRRGDVEARDMERLIRSECDYDRIPLHIDETGGLTLAALAVRARRRKHLYNTVCLIIDYLQIMGGDGRRGHPNRVQEITAITSGLKALAKALDIPIIALSQLSRQVEARDDKRPQLSDLRDSGSIEQDADAVLFVFREDYYLARREPPLTKPDLHVEWEAELEAVRGLAEIIIAKHRHGPIGTVKLAFSAPFTRFSNLVQTHEARS
jgi:replicative DNA helicase